MTTICKFIVHFLCPTREGYKDAQGKPVTHVAATSACDSWEAVQQAVRRLPKDRKLVRIEQVKMITKEVSMAEFMKDEIS